MGDRESLRRSLRINREIPEEEEQEAQQEIAQENSSSWSDMVAQEQDEPAEADQGQITEGGSSGATSSEEEEEEPTSPVWSELSSMASQVPQGDDTDGRNENPLLQWVEKHSNWCLLPMSSRQLSYLSFENKNECQWRQTRSSSSSTE